jgi:GNAT superfamily N-acetyltransferase
MMSENSVLAAMAALEPSRKAPWQRTLDLYMAPKGKMASIEIHPLFGDVAGKLASILPTLVGTAIRSWPALTDPAMTLHESSLTDEFCEDLRHIFVTAPDGEVVGAFMGGDVFVQEDWRGRGIGAEMFLARASLHDEGRRDGFLYSPGGLAAARASHRLAVKVALDLGREVPGKVLADYPDLAESPVLPKP